VLTRTQTLLLAKARQRGPEQLLEQGHRALAMPT
jgi:hypothetical protein